MKVTPQPNGNSERSQTATYFESSGGLLLNATSIITGTSKDTEEDLKTARRLKNNPSIKKYEVQVIIDIFKHKYLIRIYFRMRKRNILLTIAHQSGSNLIQKMPANHCVALSH